MLTLSTPLSSRNRGGLSVRGPVASGNTPAFPAHRGGTPGTLAFSGPWEKGGIVVIPGVDGNRREDRLENGVFRPDHISHTVIPMAASMIDAIRTGSGVKGLRRGVWPVRTDEKV